MSTYDELLPKVIDAATQAGAALFARFDPAARPLTRSDMHERGMKLEQISHDIVRAALRHTETAGWLPDDHSVPETGAWWLVDGLEGGVNHVHGLPEWAVTITLVRDGETHLTVARQPIGDLTYSAVRGAGAFLNGGPLRVSAKTGLDAAIVTASQSGNSPEVHTRFGRAFAALADRAVLVRNTIPTTFPLLAVAAGHHDAFFRYRPDPAGTATGSLLASEAGATVTDLAGKPWTVASSDLLVAAPGVHAEALEVLSSCE